MTIMRDGWEYGFLAFYFMRGHCPRPAALWFLKMPNTLIVGTRVRRNGG